jgi:hypothetical protein
LDSLRDWRRLAARGQRNAARDGGGGGYADAGDGNEFPAGNNRPDVLCVSSVRFRR